MSVCPSCKRRKATADDWAHQYDCDDTECVHGRRLCWQGDDCDLPPAPIAERPGPVRFSGPTGEDGIKASVMVEIDTVLAVMETALGPQASMQEAFATRCPAPLPGERP